MKWVMSACNRAKPKALYLNPTLQNPTTITITDQRRRDIADVARHFGIPIVEDDAYGFIPAHGHAPFAAIAPDLIINATAFSARGEAE